MPPVGGDGAGGPLLIRTHAGDVAHEAKISRGKSGDAERRKWAVGANG